ncbi:ABC transporter substrate-binding protein [Rhodoferax sp.]|uniref:ABC transporter substrate-binding protein n=1 Tax=Rhodoferax sp. TaxID=50421 RepID=UPI0025D92D85|nr:ABC transporter substrate-binding protein [Rhodoferax sp.]
MQTIQHALTALLVSAACAAAAQTGPVKFAGIMELSGSGATPGTNFNNGVKLAVKEINASGGILGRQIDYQPADSQTNPAVAKALAQKAIDGSAYVVLGPVHSGSMLVTMSETQRANVTNFTGGEAAGITQQGNPYVFRSSFTQLISMPKVARYIKDSVKAGSVAVMYTNNDYGKGGHDAMLKALEAQGIKVAADVPTDPQQIDFSAAVLKVKQSGADALFLYTLEEESARALRELRKQGYAKPIIGETTAVSQKTIELAGDAANGMLGHVGLTVDAPEPRIKAFDARFQAEYKYKSEHNGMKGYISVYVVKAMTEKLGKFDSKLLAESLHGAKIFAAQNPGVLMDVAFDKNGDLDRESFLICVEQGKQQVVQILPAMAAK